MLYIKPSDHLDSRLAVHPSQRQIHISPVSQKLHVACAISNPERYYSRYKHYQAFAKHMAESGVILHTVELALRDRHFEITEPNNPFHVQLRSESELWHKENLLNIAISHFSPDWHYGAYVDADFLLTRPDWATEAIHQLQHYSWVQLFSTYADLMPDFSPGQVWPSFASVLKDGGLIPDCPYRYDRGGLWGSPGGAWAFRREAFDGVGGLLDTCILGSADWHMGVSLAGSLNKHADIRIGSEGYLRSIALWEDRAKDINGNIGYVNNHALHFWHGKKRKRGYGSRTNILRDHNYDPYVDIKKDWQGVVGWCGNKPRLEEDVRKYFRDRDEDSTDV